jgi:hypothetical protein
MVLNDELVSVWSKLVVAYFKILPGGAEENTNGLENLSPGP